MTATQASAAWRAMTAADLAEISRIGDIVHEELTETLAILAERLRLFPQGCLVTDGGYVIVHPCRLGEPPALETLLGRLPDDADALHVHDVALLPQLRGRGLGSAAVRFAESIAASKNLAHLTLVSVHGTQPYWSRFGFAARPAPASLASYGESACYMVRRLTHHRE